MQEFIRCGKCGTKLVFEIHKDSNINETTMHMPCAACGANIVILLRLEGGMNNLVWVARVLNTYSLSVY